MSAKQYPKAAMGVEFPEVLPMRERAEAIRRNLEKRLETVLPVAMRENGIEGKDSRMAMEEDVVFTRDGCRCLEGRQTDFYLVGEKAS